MEACSRQKKNADVCLPSTPTVVNRDRPFVFCCFLGHTDTDGKIVNEWVQSQEADHDSALVVNEDYTTNATVRQSKSMLTDCAAVESKPSNALLIALSFLFASCSQASKSVILACLKRNK